MVFAITSKNWGFALYLDVGNDFHCLSIIKTGFDLICRPQSFTVRVMADKSAP